MKKRDLTCTFFVGGKQVEKLTSEQSAIIAERVGKAMSIYYTAHPEEFKKLKSK